MIRVSTLVAVLSLVTVQIATLPAASAQGSSATPALGAAQGFSDPWTRDVAVADRSPEEQREAQSLALREVLLANSGDKTLLNRDEVRAGIRDAERFIERFDFRAPAPGTVIDAGTPLTDRVRQSGEATQLMRVTFDRNLLTALIAGGDAQAAATDGAVSDAPGDPFVGVSSALMWLLIEDGRREILVTDPAAQNVRARAREIAGARGLALRYPAGDDEDSALVAAPDVRDADLERLRLASDRYAEPVVLSGHLARDGLGGWRGSWTKFAGVAVASEEFSTGSLDEALQAGISWLSASASAGDDVYRYGGNAGSDTEALVWVGSLNSVSAYATVMDFLQGVPGVGTVYPKEIDEFGMTFTVVPRGSLPAIASAADRLSWLRRTNPPEGNRSAGAFTPAQPAERATVRAPGAANEPLGSDEVVDPENARDRFASIAARGPDGRVLPQRTIAEPLAGDAELAFDYLR